MTATPITPPQKINARIGIRLLSSLIDAGLVVPFGILGKFHGGFNAGGIGALGGLGMLAYLVIQLLLVYNRSQTIGQHLLNVQVVGADDEKRIGFWRYVLLWNFIGRTLVIGAIPIINLVWQPIYFTIDHLFMLGSEQRALHDRIANARVVDLPADERRKKILDFTKI